MKEFLDYLLKAIVDHPDDVKIEEKEEGDGFLGLYVTTHPDDIGKIIGKSGKTIRALRHIVNLRGLPEKARVGIYLKDAQNLPA